MIRESGLKPVLIAFLVALSLPAAAHGASPSPNDFKNVSAYCKALRAAVGGQDFADAYGTNGNRGNAHGKCVSRGGVAVRPLLGAPPEVEPPLPVVAFGGAGGAGPDFKSVSRHCKALRAKLGGKAFKREFGKGKRKRAAFRGCIARRVVEEVSIRLLPPSVACPPGTVPEPPLPVRAFAVACVPETPAAPVADDDRSEDELDDADEADDDDSGDDDSGDDDSDDEHEDDD